MSTLGIERLEKEEISKENELISLNDELYDGFFIQELEVRLETDPLLVGGLLDMFNNSQDGTMLLSDCGANCTENSGCAFCFHCGLCLDCICIVL
jgi:hypothetical protein